jgi:hypothetical protein
MSFHARYALHISEFVIHFFMLSLSHALDFDGLLLQNLLSENLTFYQNMNIVKLPRNLS